MSGVGNPRVDQQEPGWTGHLQNKVAITLDADIRPALRGIAATGAGTVVVVLNGDPTEDAAKQVTLTLAANTPETRFAIAKVVTGGTATGLTGFR